SCTDGVNNGGESDVDCGGPCATKCANGKACGAGVDCQSSVCTGNVCVAATKGCLGPLDCQSGVCMANVCQAPSCTDVIKNGTETDVDCGGLCATKCATGKACVAGGDCQSNSCMAGVCVA